MWVEIKSDIFEKCDFKSISYVLQLLSWYPSNSIARYNIFIDIDNVKHTENYRKLLKSFEEFEPVLQSQFNDRIMNSAQIDYCISNQNSEINVFNIEEAIRFFNQPIFIII